MVPLLGVFVKGLQFKLALAERWTAVVYPEGVLTLEAPFPSNAPPLNQLVKENTRFCSIDLKINQMNVRSNFSSHTF